MTALSNNSSEAFITFSLRNFVNRPENKQGGVSRVSKLREDFYQKIRSHKTYTSFGSGTVVIDREARKVFFTQYNGMEILYTSKDKLRKVKACLQREYKITPDNKLVLMDIKEVVLKRILVKDSLKCDFLETFNNTFKIQQKTLKIHASVKERFPDHVSDVPTMFPPVLRHTASPADYRDCHGLIEMEQTRYTNNLSAIRLDCIEKLEQLRETSYVIKDMHADNRIHLDCKPFNVLSDGKHPFLSDFELSQSVFERNFVETNYAYWPKMRVKTTLWDLWILFIAEGELLFRSKFQEIVFHPDFDGDILKIELPNLLVRYFDGWYDDEFTGTSDQFLMRKIEIMESGKGEFTKEDKIILEYYLWYKKLANDVDEFEKALDRKLKNQFIRIDFLKQCNQKSYESIISYLQSKHHNIDDCIEFQNRILYLIQQQTPSHNHHATTESSFFSTSP